MSYSIIIANAFATGTPIKSRVMTGAQLAELLVALSNRKKESSL